MSVKRMVGISVVGTLALLSGGAIGSGLVSTVEYDVTDGRQYTGDGDWDPGNLKGECSPSLIRMVGLSGPADNASGTNGVFGRIVACMLTGVYTGNGVPHTVHSLRSGHDDRADSGTGDWDVNYTKAECGAAESMGGISQTSSRQVSKILCRPISCDTAAHVLATIDDGACNTVMFNTRNNRLSTSGADWSPGYMKNQCGDNQIVKGVSANPDGSIHALLCCNTNTSSC